MDFELHARTESGRRLVSLPRHLAADFADRAAEHDRDGSYPYEDVEALRASGYLAAPIPQELGGMGVESVHDLLVAAGRLSRGQPSVAIGANMHWIPLVNMAQLWRVATIRGDERRARRTRPLDGARRPRRGGHRHRRERAGPGPHPADHDGPPRRRRLDRARPQGFLHDVAGRHRCCTPP